MDVASYLWQNVSVSNALTAPRSMSVYHHSITKLTAAPRDVYWFRHEQYEQQIQRPIFHAVLSYSAHACIACMSVHAARPEYWRAKAVTVKALACLPRMSKSLILLSYGSARLQSHGQGYYTYFVILRNNLGY